MIQVIWRPKAREQLGRIIAAQTTRSAEFAAGLRRLTAELSDDPVGTGESREGPFRFAVFRPFAIYFRPAPADRCVYVVRVHLARR